MFFTNRELLQAPTIRRLLTDSLTLHPKEMNNHNRFAVTILYDYCILLRTSRKERNKKI